MAAIEVVGTIKAEPKELVPLDDKNSIVEINAQDILGDFEENSKKGGDADGNPRKTRADVTVQPSKETDQSTDKEMQENKAIDVLHVVSGNKLSDYLGQKSREETLLLNYSDNLTHGQARYKKFQEIQNRLTGASPFQKIIIEKVQNKAVFKIESDEYTLLPDKHYQCNHCLFVIGNKNKMWTHIRHNHKDRLVTPEIYESSLKILSKMSDAKSYVSWIEYTPQDDDHYRCNHCLIVMKGANETEQHIITNHRQLKIIQCPYCPFQSRHGITSHIRSMHNDKEYFRCGCCDYKSKLKAGLTRHIKCVHLGLKLFQCSECPKIFQTPKNLSRHVLHIHKTGDLEKLKCFHCSYESISKECLTHHIQSRHMKMDSLETFQCQLCPFKTKLKIHFRAHKNRHVQVKVCHVCSYTCRTTTLLDLHLMTHKEKMEDTDLKYRCDQCDYKTYRVYSLQVHLLKHKKPEEIQYFYCYHCDFKAKRKDNLKTHIFRHVKKKEIKYDCYICDFKTIKKDVLVRHINKHASRVELQDKKNIHLDERPNDTKYTIKRKTKLSNSN